MGDLIERDEAIKLMNEAADFENKRRYEHLDNRLAFHRYLHGECCFKRAATKLKNMPAAETENRKLAYLKKIGINSDLYKCSACGCAYTAGVNRGYVILNYCSKCGARIVRDCERARSEE